MERNPPWRFTDNYVGNGGATAPPPAQHVPPGAQAGCSVALCQAETPSETLSGHTLDGHMLTKHWEYMLKHKEVERTKTHQNNKPEYMFKHK